MISSESIALWRVRESDLEWLREQRNRPEIMKYFRQIQPLTKKEQEQWFQSRNESNSRLFLVYTKSSPYPKPVGYVALSPIDPRHNHAEFSIFIVPEHQGRGYAKEAMGLLLSYAFDNLHLHKVYSDVLDYPQEDRFGFYRSLGFKAEGRHRQHYLKNGVIVDSIQFSILEHEYISNRAWKHREKALSKP